MQFNPSQMKQHAGLLFTWIIFLLLIPASASCNDSLVITSLRADGGTLEGICITATNDGSNLISGIYKQDGVPTQKGLVVKADPTGNIVWNTTLESAGKSVLINKIVEFTSGNILIAGRRFENSNPDISVPFITQLNASGQILWTRTIGESLVNSNNIKIAVTSLAEGLAGDILIVATASGILSGSDADHGILIRMNAVGVIVVNNLFVSTAGSLNNFIGVSVHNGNIVIFGFVIDDECAQSDTRAIYNLKLDYNSGNLLDTKRFCFAATPTTISYAVLRHNYRVEKIQNKFVLWGLLAETGSTKRDQLVVVFNDTLGLEESRSIYAPFITASRVQLKPDNFFNFHAIGNKPGSNDYYSLFALNGQVKTQTSHTTVLATDHYLTEGGSNMSFSGRRLSYFRNTATTPYPAIELTKRDLEYKAYKSCSVIDTAFPVIVRPFELYTSTLKFQSVESDLIPVLPAIFIQSTIALTVERLCSDENICNMIKITGPDTVCTVEGQVFYSVSKNTRCNKQVVWDIKQTDINTLNKINDSTIAVSFRGVGSGSSKVRIYAYIDGEKAIIDSIDITLHPPGNFLNPQFVLCPGDTIALTPGSWFKTYLWQDGSTDSIFKVTRAGTYTVTFKSYCSGIQTKTIKIAEPPPILVGINNRTLCEGQSIDIIPETGYTDYSWKPQQGLQVLPDGKTARITSLGEHEIFFVQVSAFAGCLVTDSIQVTLHTPIKPNLGNDTSICSGKKLTLLTAIDFKSYSWNDGKTTSNNTISSPGTYWLNVSDFNGCPSGDTIVVTDKKCTQGVFFPTAFSPNYDGRNDQFKPVIKGDIANYNLKIYNRYGQIVFANTHYNTGWNGRFQDKLQPAGTYVWTCSYQLKGEINRVEKGSLILIR
jgi:gliding motility-associated-like protein